jgi:hypothetical protein
MMSGKPKKIPKISTIIALSRNVQSIRHDIGRRINLGFPAFLIVLAFRLFWLSGHSSFLETHSRPSKTKIRKGEAHSTIYHMLPFVKKIAY